MRADARLLAQLLDLLSNILVIKYQLGESKDLVIGQKDTRALFAHALQNVDDVLEVALMENRQLECDIPEVSWARNLVFSACLADSIF